LPKFTDENAFQRREPSVRALHDDAGRIARSRLADALPTFPDEPRVTGAGNSEVSGGRRVRNSAPARQVGYGRRFGSSRLQGAWTSNGLANKGKLTAAPGASQPLCRFPRDGGLGPFDWITAPELNATPARPALSIPRFESRRRGHHRSGPPALHVHIGRQQGRWRLRRQSSGAPRRSRRAGSTTER
jgi:hypothetical protein